MTVDDTREDKQRRFREWADKVGPAPCSVLAMSETSKEVAVKQVKFIRELATFPKSGPWHIDSRLIRKHEHSGEGLPDPRLASELRCAKASGFGVLVWFENSPMHGVYAHWAIFGMDYGEDISALEFSKHLVKEPGAYSYPPYSNAMEWHEAECNSYGYVKFDGEAEEVVLETYISADSLNFYPESRAMVFKLAGELFAADGHRIEPRDFHAPGIEFVDVTGHND